MERFVTEHIAVVMVVRKLAVDIPAKARTEIVLINNDKEYNSLR